MTWAEFSGPFRHAQGAKGVSYWGGESATPLARLEVALRNFSGWIRSAALLGGDLAACHAGRPNQGLTGAQSSLLGGAWRSDAARLSGQLFSEVRAAERPCAKHQQEATYHDEYEGHEKAGQEMRQSKRLALEEQSIHNSHGK